MDYNMKYKYNHYKNYQNSYLDQKYANTYNYQYSSPNNYAYSYSNILSYLVGAPIQYKSYFTLS